MRLYMARGGRENSGTWWLETVDLSQINSRAWPGDDISPVRVTFIGLSVAGGPAPGTAHISSVKLSR